MTVCSCKPTRLAVAMALLSGAGLGLAQTPPNSGDALRQAQPPIIPAVPAPALPAIGGESPIAPPMEVLPAGPRIAISRIQVVGNREIATPTLNALVADASGKSLALSELEALAQRITRYYRTQGYFVARAYVPAQEVADGVIQIRVVEGNYGAFHLENHSLVRDDIVQGILDAVKGADIVSLDTLERAMLIINDTPGVRVTRADVMPGDKVGTSDFAVDTAAGPRYAGYVMLDNYGSVYTGKARLSFNTDVNSPTGGGDLLSVSGLATNDGDLLNGGVAYTAPLSTDGLRGGIAVSDTQYALGSTYSSLDAKGTAKGLDLTLTYPLRRIQAQTVELNLDLSHKALEDKIDATHTINPKNSTALTAGAALRDEGRLLGLDGQTRLSLQLSYGLLNIDDPVARAQDAAGENTQGNYTKVVAEASRTSALPAGFRLTATLKHQQTLGDKNLDGSERMAVSGPSAVMAYPADELIGTVASFFRLELSQPLADLGGLTSSWLVFTDYGTARAANPLPSDEDRHISDVGLGWTGMISGASLRATLAHRLDSTPAVSEPYPRTKLLVQAGWVF